MNKDKQDTDYVPDWVGPCAYCEKHINAEDDHIQLFLEEYATKDERDLIGATLCSERCLETTLSHGTSFTQELKHYDREDQPRPRTKTLESDLTELPELTEGLNALSCCYCGKLIHYDNDYRLDLTCDGVINGEPILIFFNCFCSKECFDKATSLGRKYLKFAVNAYSQDRCFQKQLEMESKDE